MYDFHVHSNYSSDSPSSMQRMVLAGQNMGLRGLCFTDHVDLDYQSTEISFNFCYSDYVNELKSVKSAFCENFEIYTGVELGMQPHINAENEAFLKGKGFDFIIGSVHCVNKKSMYDGSFLTDKTHEECIKDYFDDMLHCIDNFKNFDVLGHLDIVRRYLPGSEEDFSYETYKGYVYDILKRLINSYKGIEVNTSGLRFGLSSFHPLPEILKLYHSLGGEIITIGSDSHIPEALGFELRTALSILYGIGFKYYTIYKDRKPVFIKI